MSVRSGSAFGARFVKRPILVGFADERQPLAPPFFAELRDSRLRQAVFVCDPFDGIANRKIVNDLPMPTG